MMPIGGLYDANLEVDAEFFLTLIFPLIIFS